MFRRDEGQEHGKNMVHSAHRIHGASYSWTTGAEVWGEDRLVELLAGSPPRLAICEESHLLGGGAQKVLAKLLSMKETRHHIVVISIGLGMGSSRALPWTKSLLGWSRGPALWLCARCERCGHLGHNVTSVHRRVAQTGQLVFRVSELVGGHGDYINICRECETFSVKVASG